MGTGPRIIVGRYSTTSQIRVLYSQSFPVSTLNFQNAFASDISSHDRHATANCQQKSAVQIPATQAMQLLF